MDMSGERDSVFRLWSVALGLPAATYGTGLAVLTFHFWLGVVIAYAASIWFLVDWLVVSQKESTYSRLYVMSIPIASALLVTWIAFRPAPMDINALALKVNYRDDTTIAGIKWKDKYSDMRVTLRDDADDPYINIVIILRTDLLIANVGLLSQLSQCQWAPHFPGVVLSGASVTISGIDKKGDISIPIFTPEDGPIAATQYKISCDKILPHDNMELIVALEPPPMSGTIERKSPSWVSITVEYDAYGRSHEKGVHECFTNVCNGIIEVQK